MHFFIVFIGIYLNKIFTWKYSMMVHIKPNTIDGRPSTISVELMFTSLICVKKNKIIIISDILECLQGRTVSDCSEMPGIAS